MLIFRSYNVNVQPYRVRKLVNKRKGWILMNREFLEELGLEKETIDKVMKEHGKAIQAVKPADDYEDLKTTNQSLQTQLQQLQDTLNEKETELNGVEDIKQELQKYKIKNLKTSIAVEAGIPLELAGRLSGETEDELKADAETLAGFVNKKQPLPLRPSEPDVNNETREMEQMLDQLTGKQ